ncbi:lysozyme inhibitor LprI family protein [Metabacillus litoralis]|uniref:lysozyme inhibitor LprI family protein n=1 Tax=Metabacillus litoralis TaxID=152268 RepID=UPI001CFF2740|nr:lysozyme inhibitor LprI family protein [Metabacillus litoralis]
MKINKGILIIFSTLMCFIVLSACGSSTENSSTTLENQSQNNSSNQSTNEEFSENAPDSESNDRDKKEIDNNDTNEKEDTSSKNTAIDETSSSNNTDENMKEKYVKKINETKSEAEKLEATDSSTYALKKVEDDRWGMWDQLLNEIYGALKEQLPAEELEQLKEEQRNWIKNRDERALEASLKYKGGTQEHLEYSAVSANITEERCYELVEDYMK